MDYGQPADRSEWRAVQDVANRLDLEVKKVELGFRLGSQSGKFFGRNALLVLTSAGKTESRPLTANGGGKVGHVGGSTVGLWRRDTVPSTVLR